MKAWANYNPSELSSGQQQKVSLARALITDPEIIIADEPTGNLDYKSGQLITGYLKDLASKGKTVIMVTHNLDYVNYAERVINIFDGQVADDIQVGSSSVDDIKQSLIKERTKDSEDEPIKKELDILIDEQSRIYESAKDKKRRISRLFINLKNTIVSILLGTLLVILKIVEYFLSFRFLPKFIKNLKNPLEKFCRMVVNLLNRNEGGINYFDVFTLSYHNLFAKRNRTLVTIIGVSFGIGFTAFLISIGYGLEQLVISRSAQLEQLKQIDAYPPLGESIKIDDESISNIRDINNVDQVLPVINVAGKVNYQNSNIDVVVYGVQSDYLDQSDFTLVAGEYYKSNENYLVSYPVSAPSTSTTVPSSDRNAVVNLAFLDLIGLSAENAVGKTFGLRYVPINSQGASEEIKQTVSEDYIVTGIISSNQSPIIYTPIKEVKKSGISDYTQVRIVTSNPDFVNLIRQQLNVLGYRTTSVQDTVSQIEGFFSTARIIFAIVGLVALFVGSLGMFNTLTVSLLERTREVGLLKTMGMKSNEVKDLFISEAIIMGVFGGLFGIVIGLLGGLLLSVILSAISVLRGFEPLNVTYLPFTTAVLIVLISALTGIATGFYPSRRATKISALDALRYE
jgi:ABC-type antimicrobial peptide transport system permease subunit